ncbi:hypothetical protein [Heyndrickxia oleronia]|uniref:hypothetical protein n=1 Tax=Heyndrickxia oleronia TaxID=38875 RepID=UPI00375072DC
MDIKISPFLYEDKPILDQLIQLYRYDSSEFDGHCLNAHGRYSYKYLESLMDRGLPETLHGEGRRRNCWICINHFGCSKGVH